MSRTNANLNINRIYRTQLNQIINNSYHYINNNINRLAEDVDMDVDVDVIPAADDQIQPRGHARFRTVASLAEMRRAMRIDFEFFIEYEDFYNIARGQGFNRQQADAARFQYLCAVGNIEELDKWITDYIRDNDNGENEFYFMANRPIRIPHIDYSLYPIVTAIMWNDDPQLIRYLCSYGLEINVNDELRRFPEEAAIALPYFNPVAHLFPNTPALFQGNLNVVITNNNNNNTINFQPQHFIRDAADFQNVIREINYITGERIAPAEWQPIIIRNAGPHGQAYQT